MFTDLISGVAERWVFFNGDNLIKEGLPGGNLLVLVQGEAEVLKGGQVVGRVRPGDVVGEIQAIGTVLDAPVPESGYR